MGLGVLVWPQFKNLESHAPSSPLDWGKGGAPFQVTLHFPLSAPAWAPVGEGGGRAEKLARKRGRGQPCPLLGVLCGLLHLSQLGGLFWAT